MVTHLYKNFLENDKVYKQNIDFWKTIVYTLLSIENITFQNYISPTKKDGSLFKDGNPIYNFKVNNSNRAVRIIQEEIETNKLEFSAWLSTLQLANDDIVDELVISMELSNESVLLTIELINAWIINNFPEQKMEKYIDKLFLLKETIFNATTLTQDEVYA
ncbi:MAG: hypothetical protein DRJ05_09895 [Bacteroidetes bacterium]|nr:MAG: hypothetical protein DRJ05_09895 [Bacteroidota bacterium]